MSDELDITLPPEPPTAAPKKIKAKPKGRPTHADVIAKQKAEIADLKAKLQTREAVAEHFEKIDGFVDEHDRAKLKHRELIETAKETGADPEAIIEQGLDSSEVRGIGHKGMEFIKAHRLRWVNKTSRNGARISYHKGRGFFLVRPSEHPVRPTHGIKEENSWIFGESILMAEPMDYYRRNRERALTKMLHQGADMREGTREEINRLIREETGQPHARDGLTKSYRDNTWDRVDEGQPFVGPSANAIAPAS